ESVRLPRIAPGLPLWRRGILLLNHNRENRKGRKRSHTPGPSPFQQRTNTSWRSIQTFDPNPRFHGGCFGVWGTTPLKPLNCKIRFALPSRTIEPSWAHHVGDDSKLVFARLGFAPEDII